MGSVSGQLHDVCMLSKDLIAKQLLSQSAIQNEIKSTKDVIISEMRSTMDNLSRQLRDSWPSPKDLASAQTYSRVDHGNTSVTDSGSKYNL